VFQFVKDFPSLTRPVSQACTQGQFESAAYEYWCARIKETPRYHRKQWEYCYILQALATSGALAPGRRGLGYGVGLEPLSAVFANYGCRIVATDLDTASASTLGWTNTQQHASHKAAMNDRGICDPATFDSNVEFQFVDMNRIPEDFRGFDFTWSACALEHLGSIHLGLKFIENTVRTLRPGGIAVHTTELNCSSDTETLDSEGTVLFRKSDIISVCERLTQAGCDVVLNFNTGNLPFDHYVDVAPYNPDKHLKLQLGRFTTTSFGLVIRAAPNNRNDFFA
jgi:SAM-dependent methyltransferase